MMGGSGCGCECGGEGGGGGGGGPGGGCDCRAKARGVLRLEGDAAFEEDFVQIYGLSMWESKQTENATLQQDPNFLFSACCAERNLPAGCQRRCNFAAYNQDLLGKMFVGADECPLDSLPEMHFCEAQGRDHTKCCAKRGVNTATAYDKCLVFCDQLPDKFTKIDYTFASCYEKFDDIKHCFYDDVHDKARKLFASHKVAAATL